MNKLPITDLTTFTFQDYPEHTACIVWFGGCNFRCPFCHNPEFVIDNFKTISEEKIFNFLKARIGLIEGVVLSGGECTLSNEVYYFIQKIKSMGFLVKIDTNGTNFELVKSLINDKLIDFVALDYKAPQEKFCLNSGTNIEKFYTFSKTLDFLIKSGTDMEIRTTVHTDLLNENDINNIIKDLENRGYNKKYYIQNYKNYKGRTIGNMTDQTRILNKDLIISQKFNVVFRNFK